jgi:hypothetical protein
MTAIRDAILALLGTLALAANGATSRPPGKERRARRPRPSRPRSGTARSAFAGFRVGCAALLLLVLLLGGVAFRRGVWRDTAEELLSGVRTPDVAALGPAPVAQPPSIARAKIRSVLRSYRSPAVGEADAFYDLGLQYGIDPAYSLAFFVVESQAGTRGIAATTHSIGNIRARPGEPDLDGYRLYGSWREGIEDWYRLIAHTYVGSWGLTTIDAIVPVYAPSWDNNDPDAYARAVKTLVARWRGL